MTPAEAMLTAAYHRLDPTEQARVILDAIGPDPAAERHRADLLDALTPPPSKCTACGQFAPRRRGEQRTYCGPDCRKQHTAEQRAALIEDTEWLLDSGETTQRIATRLGYGKPDSLAKRLRAAGRFDLARRLTRQDVTP